MWTLCVTVEPQELNPGRSLGPRKSHCQCLRTGESGQLQLKQSLHSVSWSSTCIPSTAWCLSPLGKGCCRWLMDLIIGALSALWDYLSPSNWLRKSTKTGNPGKLRTRLLLYRVLIGWFVFPGNYTLTGGAHHSLHQDQDHAPGILQLSTSAAQTSSSLVYTSQYIL